MELLAYTAAGIILYLAADRLVDMAERMAGRRFAYRTIYFFLVLSGLALGSFGVLRALLP